MNPPHNPLFRKPSKSARKFLEGNCLRRVGGFRPGRTEISPEILISLKCIDKKGYLKVKFLNQISQNVAGFIPNGQIQGAKIHRAVWRLFLIKNSEEVSITRRRYNQSAYKAALNTDSAFCPRNPDNTHIFPVQ